MKVIDMHCDTIGAIYEAAKNGKKKVLRENDLHVDLMKMVQSDYMVQNFAMFVPLSETDNPFETCVDMIDLYYQELSQNTDLIRPVYQYKDIADNLANGYLSALLTVEEGEVVKGSLSKLRALHRLGVRLITLTWNFKNSIGSPNFTIPENGEPDFLHPNTTDGLTSFGLEMVSEMEQLGMIIDVSHLSDAGFYDVLHHTTKPFVASHSNARAMTPVCRNMSDDMIRALAEQGGFMGLNYCPDFVTSKTGSEPIQSTIADIVRHILYIIQVGGEDVIGLGSDFDGIPSNLELKDASYLPMLADALHTAGLCESQIEKIFWKNAMRIYKEVLH